MSSERQYTQAEIAEIFNKASREQERIKEKASSEGGLTLSDLHSIAKEAGIAPELITQAAHSLHQSTGVPKKRTFMGMTIGVSKTVELGGELSNHDWEKLVIDIRETFGARGKLTSEGSIREWSNGNLHIIVEPSASGHILRMGTFKGSAQGTFIAALSFILVSFIIGLTMVLRPGFNTGMMATAIIFSLFGLIWAAATQLQLSQWSDDRTDQMDAIATKAISMVASRQTPAVKTSLVESQSAPHLETRGILDLEDESPEQEAIPPSKNRTR